MRAQPGFKFYLAVLAVCVVVVAAVASCKKKPKTPACDGNDDCAEGLVCVNKQCVQCSTSAECGEGKECKEGACVAKAECTKDLDCPDGQVCQAGQCRACANDGECGPGGQCLVGKCKRATACKVDEDCADDEDCIDGFCQRPWAGGGGDAGCQLATVFFALDDASIAQSERDRLDTNQQCIEKNGAKTVMLVGHTDQSGTDEYNIALSERRAQTVADYLARLGTDPARLHVVPKGESELSGNGDDKDRRVEFLWK